MDIDKPVKPWENNSPKESTPVPPPTYQTSNVSSPKEDSKEEPHPSTGNF